MGHHGAAFGRERRGRARRLALLLTLVLASLVAPIAHGQARDGTGAADDVPADAAPPAPLLGPSSPAASAAPGTAAASAPAGGLARRAACRPAAPAVAPTPGRSVVVDRGPADCNAVALTFDAGADRGYAELILDVLRQEGVPAAFGMTGVWAEQNPDLVRRMADEGHELINHTWDHRSFTGFSPGTRPLSVGERRLQLDRTEELLVGLTGRSTRPYFRPPYGDLNEGALKDVADAGYDYTIMWTVDSFGWMTGARKPSAAGIIDRCLRLAEPGAIYIFHVGAQSEDGPALRGLIEGLRARGYAFATVTDLLGL